MSSKSAMLRGITNNDVREIVSKALDDGWEVGEFTSKAHATIVHTETGKKVTVPTTLGRNGRNTVARRIKDVSGQDFIPRSHRKKSRKKFEMAGYIKTTRTEEQELLNQTKEEMKQQHADLVMEFRILAMPPHDRAIRDEAIKVIGKMVLIEQYLASKHMVVETPIENLVDELSALSMV